MSDEIGFGSFGSVSLVPTLQQSTALIESDPERIAEYIVDKLHKAGFGCIVFSMDGQETVEASQLSWLDIQRHRATGWLRRTACLKARQLPARSRILCYRRLIAVN
jgi:hypothetical protein